MFRPLTNLFHNLCGIFETKFPEEQKPNVLVIGYGWGGRAFCDKIDRRKYHVEIVNMKPFFLNTPKLVQKVATGIDTSVRGRIIGPNVSYGNCINIDTVKHEAIFKISSDNFNNNDIDSTNVSYSDFSQKYDYLVLAVGSVPNTFGIPGAETCKFLKTYNDANLLANTLAEDKDKKQKIDIIGAGPTGCELALALAAQGRTIRLLEAASGILGAFSEQTRSAVIAEMKASGVALELNTMVHAIKEDKIETSSGEFERGLTVWTSGIKANPLIRFLTNERFLTTDKHLRVSGYNNIYALGDIVGGRGPPTAQNAQAQGYYLASHFNRNFQSDDDEYKYVELGKIIHSPKWIYLDYKGNSYKLPKFFEYLFDKFME